MATDADTDPVMAHAQMQAPNKRQDDFDMAKLQKSLKQEQRRSLMSKQKVAKLTPAEIRSLNHSASLSKSGSVRSSDGQSDHRLGSNTPPLTPDTQPLSQQSLQTHLQERPLGADLPTPPLSPDRERRSSISSARHIHSPRPLSHTQAAQFANASNHSRPPSASSYRGIATYRGPEITRTGSLTMLQRPSQQIVSNPLSQFSRPRQSTLTSSPQRLNSEQRGGEDFVSPIVAADRQSSANGIASPVAMRRRNQSLGAVSHDPSREHSPIRSFDSPIPTDNNKMSELSKSTTNEEVPVVHVTPRSGPEGQKDAASEPAPKQSSSWRRSMTAPSESAPDPAPLRKEYRRRTLMSPKHGYCLGAICYADTKPGEPPQLRDSLKDELPSSRTSMYTEREGRKSTADTEYGQHPAVRPLSTDVDRPRVSTSDYAPSSSRKGKQREIDPNPDIGSDSVSMTSSMPSYSRCSCCGRIQKPGGFESELSPVMENENLRTNFNFEAEKGSEKPGRRSSSVSSNQRNYVPIIPKEVGGRTKQARIEPVREPVREPVKDKPHSMTESAPDTRGVAVNQAGDVIAPSSTPLAIMPRARVDPKVVRFASLHMRKEDRQEEENQEEAQELAPPPQIQRFVSLYGLRAEAQQQQSRQDQTPQQQQQQQQAASQLPANYRHYGGNQLQQHPQSAYQAQQARLYPSAYQPVRSSRLAYQYSDGSSYSTGSEVTGSAQSATPASMGGFEKPLGDSPTSSQNNVNPPVSSHESLDGDDDDGPMVDLSSFDGSFVHNSLSRSATLMRETTPYATPINHNTGTMLRNTNEPNIGRAITTNGDHSQMAPRTPINSYPPTIDTTVENHDYHSPASAPAASGPQSYTSSKPSTPTYSPHDTNSIHSLTTVPRPGAGTTVVRIVPSPPVTSTNNPPTSGKGQLKLGDWVLPESQIPLEIPQRLSSRKRALAAA